MRTNCPHTGPALAAGTLLLLMLLLVASPAADAVRIHLVADGATSNAEPTTPNDMRRLLVQASAKATRSTTASTQACEQWDGGVVSGTGVRDCYTDRALRDATAECNKLAANMRNDGKAVRPCTACAGGKGKSVWIVGQVDSDFWGGSWGSARKCSFSAEYGCCFEVRDPFASASQATGSGSVGGNVGRTSDQIALVQDPCACTPMTKNPVTGVTISCSCYFKDQGAGRTCTGAKYGDSSKMWFKYC